MVRRLVLRSGRGHKMMALVCCFKFAFAALVSTLGNRRLDANWARMASGVQPADLTPGLKKNSSHFYFTFLRLGSGERGRMGGTR